MTTKITWEYQAQRIGGHNGTNIMVNGRYMGYYYYNYNLKSWRIVQRNAMGGISAGSEAACRTALELLST